MQQVQVQAAKTHPFNDAQPIRNRRLVRRILDRFLTHLVLTVLGITFGLPFLWLLTTSLKANRQIFVWPPVLIPDPLIWRNYTDTFTFAPLHLYALNSLIIAAAHVFGATIISALAGYAFARLRAPGKNLIFMLVISTMMVPGVVTLVPLFILFAKLRWVDTFLPLTIPVMLGTPFFIFLLRQFFLTLPEEMIEAAVVDGASQWRIWWKIAMPNAMPALATAAVFSFIAAWNDFVTPLVFLNSRSKYTLALGLQVFLTEHNAEWGLLMAASTMTVFPIILLFFFAQKQFIQGIALTGIKG
jgi:multiple sugar transport system permease protein